MTERPGRVPGARRAAGLLVGEWKLWGILALAALLRFGWPGVTQFSYDEARLSTLALDWVQGGPVPLAGMVSSLGFRFPPFNVYLLAIPYALSPNPLVAVNFIALANVVSILWLYVLARHWFGHTAAWSSALLLAVNPWAVLYSRSLWANFLLPPFVLLCVTAGYFALARGRWGWLVALPVAVALTIQIHISGAAMVVWAVVMLLLFRRRIRWRALLLGVGLAVLTWLPYLLHLSRNWREEWGAVSSTLGRPSMVDAEVLHHVWRIASGHDIHSLAGPVAYRDFVASLPPYGLLFSLAGLLAVAAVAWLVLRAVRRPGAQRAVSLLLLVWLLAPLPLYLRHSVPLYPHYLIVLFPAIFLAVGALTGDTLARHPRVGTLVGALVLGIAAAQALITASLLEFVSTHATPGGMSILLRDWQAATDHVRQTPVCEVKIISDRAWPIYHSEPAVLDLLLHDDPRVLYSDAAQLESAPTYEDGRTLVLLTPPRQGATAAAQALYQTAQSDSPRVALRSGEGTIRLLYEDGGRPQARPVQLEPTTFANGVRLLDAAVGGEVAGGGTLRLFLHWELISPPPHEVYVFNHLFDASGERVAQADGIICPMNQWHPAQRVWTWYDLEMAAEAPPAPYTLRTGLYRFPEIENVGVVDSTGQIVTDAVTLEISGHE